MRAKRELASGLFKEGREGVVYNVTFWTGKASVRFDPGQLLRDRPKREGLGEDDIEKIS